MATSSEKQMTTFAVANPETMLITTISATEDDAKRIATELMAAPWKTLSNGGWRCVPIDLSYEYPTEAT